MHGRLKVRTTAEVEERKKLEREKKLKLYKSAMSQCLTWNEKPELDKQVLKLSEELLSSNGDIQTLWNMRKKIIEAFVKEETVKDEEKIKHYVDEMALTEFCLKKNPKSYSCWHQRRWCLARSDNLGFGARSKDLSWENELKLCSKFLETDERNFHCWRHRSFVIESGGLSKLNELEFTYEKICSNFSNYSAWHYRSKLIKHLYKENTDSALLEKELNLIEQALFTDPNDQSAWIYEKWLLIEHNCSYINELLFDATTRMIRFNFSKPINMNEDIVFIKFNGRDLLCANSIKMKNESDDANVWSCNMDDILVENQNFIKIEICFKNCGFPSEVLLERGQDTNEFVFKPNFETQVLDIGSELIVKHLKNILELSELESQNSKWCLLTLVEIMSSVDFDKYRSTIFAYLDKLANEIDVYRKNFYLDLKKKLGANNK